jgi:hypothetical protein
MIYDWAIDGRGGLRSGIMRGNQAGGVKSLTWHLEARGRAERGGQGRQGEVAERQGSTDMRWGMELMGGTRMAVT